VDRELRCGVVDEQGAAMRRGEVGGVCAFSVDGMGRDVRCGAVV
jgi:hypothetical protein